MSPNTNVKLREKKMYNNYVEVEGYDEDTLNFIIKKRGHPELIIEIGSGAGAWTKHLAEHSTIVALDFSSFAIQRLRDITKDQSVFGLIGDAENLPFRNNCADECFFGFVLHHVPDYMKSITEAVQVINKDGGLVMIETNGSNIFRSISNKIGIFFKLRNTKSYIERPLKIHIIKSILSNLKLVSYAYPCSITIKKKKKCEAKPSKLVTVYNLLLEITDVLLPSIYGSSDFILLASACKESQS
jgi:ubiquinone/menaquinone biosynthesis C-methylase UbiE